MKQEAVLPLAGLVDALGSKLYESLELEKIMIAVRDPQSGEIAQFEGNRGTSDPRPSRGYAIVSQPLSHHGVQVGQIELHSASASLKAAQLLRIAQNLQDEILDARHMAKAA